MKRLFWIILVCTVSLITSLVPVYGSAVWYSFESENLGQFITKVGEKQYEATLFPDADGFILSQTTYRTQAGEGSWVLGFQHSKISDLDYNQHAAQFAYHFLREEPLPYPLSSINFNLLRYKRTDLLLDLNLHPLKDWQFSVGARLLSAEDLIRFKVMEAEASEVQDELTGYDLYGYTSIWLANQKAGFGSSYAFSIDYRPTSPFSFFLRGDDLFGKIHWQGIDFYHGIIDLDVIKPDEEGIDSLHPPIRGDEYTHNATLKVAIPPDFRGGISYTTFPVTFTSWLRYHKFWEVGIKGTYDFPHLAPLTVGCIYRAGKWLYLGEIDTGNISFKVAINRAKDVTDLNVGVALYLY